MFQKIQSAHLRIDPDIRMSRLHKNAGRLSLRAAEIVPVVQEHRAQHSFEPARKYRLPIITVRCNDIENPHKPELLAIPNDIEANLRQQLK
jgi:hypothetical protein